MTKFNIYEYTIYVAIEQSICAEGKMTNIIRCTYSLLIQLDTKINVI
jgi:hypothetical protein